MAQADELRVAPGINVFAQKRNPNSTKNEDFNPVDVWYGEKQFKTELARKCESSLAFKVGRKINPEMLYSR